MLLAMQVNIKITQLTNKSNLSYVGKTENARYLRSIAIDDTYVYAGTNQTAV